MPVDAAMEYRVVSIPAGYAGGDGSCERFSVFLLCKQYRMQRWGNLGSMRGGRYRVKDPKSDKRQPRAVYCKPS